MGMGRHFGVVLFFFRTLTTDELRQGNLSTTVEWEWDGTVVSSFSFPGIAAPLTHPRRCPDGVTAACQFRQPEGAGSIPAWGSNKTKDEQVLVRFVLTNSDDVGTHQVVRAGGNSCRLCCVYTYQRRDQAGKPVAIPLIGNRAALRCRPFLFTLWA